MPSHVSRSSSNGWNRQLFTSLDQHYATMKRLRPDLAWTSRQLTPGRIEGTAIAHRGPRFAVTCSAMRGSYEMKGPVSRTNLALSLALHFPTTGLHWMQPVGAGMVGVYQPGTDVDVINRDSVSFVVIDIPRAELEREADREGLVIPAERVNSSGVAPGRVGAAPLARIACHVGHLHNGQPISLPPGVQLSHMILAATLGHLAAGQAEPQLSQAAYCRIVARARAYIEAHLGQPIAIDDLVASAVTSRRTLHRAFLEVLGETPQGYVLKLRLNRIRQELASPKEARRTVTTVSHRWGIAELGWLAARYNEQFGELPSTTLARRTG
ncbi:helix-turn-helix domain-containing protein [Sandaracinobacteroides hominis]|uniref:helix-turn-helix domain-containing protein n=1 Tax=Sandaracinobacteroides hominis TaxID=2780086 RepID=UPI0018F4E873|nr:helix-turn-helix domain-containing protein [Sandaracinobacteroides hominis]